MISLNTLASYDQVVRAQHTNQNNALALFNRFNWLILIDNGDANQRVKG